MLKIIGIFMEWFTEHLVSVMAIILSLLSLVDRRRSRENKEHAEAERLWRQFIRDKFTKIDKNTRLLSNHLLKSDKTYENGLDFD